MKVYRAKRGWFIKLILSVVLIADFAIIVTQKLHFSFIFSLTLLAAILIWMYADTYYKIQNNLLIYKSAFLFGTVTISSITKISRSSTSWVGLRPATDLNGLVITYNFIDSIYISPIEQEKLVAELKSLNPSIEVVL